jgi:four helix bundle protein
VTIRRFEDLEGWKRARELTTCIYKTSNGELFRRDFSLRDQLRRSGVSIMANIAEGFGRKGKAEFSRFLTIAQASSFELRSHLYVALDTGYLDQEHFQELFGMATRVENLIGGLLRHLRTS